MAVLSTIEQERIALYEEMTPSTQAVARQLAEKFVKEYTGIIKIQYQVGTIVAQVIDNESEYGDGAVEQLATYLNVPHGQNTLYGLANFARKFEKEYVEEKSVKLMANGGALTVQHWVQLSRLSERTDAEAMLDRIYTECLSARDLELAIRAGTGGASEHTRSGGGRNPKIPSTPAVGLQALFQLSNKLVRFAPTVEKHVFKKLKGLDAETVTPLVVDKSKQTLAMLETVIERATEMRDSLSTSVKTMEQALTDAAEDEEKQAKEKAKEKEAKEKAKEKEAKEKAKEKEAKEKAKEKTKEQPVRGTDKRKRKIRPIAAT